MYEFDISANLSEIVPSCRADNCESLILTMTLQSGSAASLSQPQLRRLWSHQAWSCIPGGVRFEVQGQGL